MKIHYYVLFLIISTIFDINLVSADLTLDDDYLEEVITYRDPKGKDYEYFFKVKHKSLDLLEKDPNKAEKYLLKRKKSSKYRKLPSSHKFRLDNILLDAFWQQKKYVEFEDLFFSTMTINDLGFYAIYSAHEHHLKNAFNLSSNKYDSKEKFNEFYETKLRNAKGSAKIYFAENYFLQKKIDLAVKILEELMDRGEELSLSQISQYGILLASAKLIGDQELYNKVQKHTKTLQYPPNIEKITAAAMLFLKNNKIDYSHNMSDKASNPLPIFKIQPDYPRRAVKKKLSGYVIIKHSVSSEGRVINPVVVESNPKNVFDKSALDAVKHFFYVHAVNENLEPIATHNLKNKISFKVVD